MKSQLTRSARLMVALVLVLGFLWVPGAGAAQDLDDCEEYPDGCGTTTTTEPEPEPECGISQTTVQVGATVEVTLSNIEVGATFRVLVAGSEVARSTAQGPQSFLPMQTERTSQSVSFTVPDLAPGVYTVVAVGADFTIICGDGGLQVLGSSSSRDGGGLAFTGATILGLIALALVLLLVGYALRRRSRRHGHA